MLEAVVNARTKEKDHEIELYRAFNLGTCDEKNIKDTLDDYPKGANNGNIGYGNLIDYKWERFKEYEEK